MKNATHTGILELPDQTGRRIRAGIVDQNQFETAGQRFQGGDDLPGQRHDVFFFVVGRNDDGEPDALRVVCGVLGWALHEVTETRLK